jgi:sugar (pentulose or hexulose) kinase
MKLKKNKSKKQDSQATLKALKNEEAMIAGIIEGSPDAIGVAIVRLSCGCKKMAAVDKEGEPASKVIIYRDEAQEVCPECKEDNGAFARVKEAFIHWEDPQPEQALKQKIEEKVLGTMPTVH